MADPSIADDDASKRLRMLAAVGQSVWLDFIDRSLLETGELSRLIERDGVSGVTSNPSIFEKAIARASDYDHQLIDELSRPDARPRAVYDALVGSDVSAAADLLLPTYHRHGGRDGYVSIEVAPELASDTRGTVDEAKHLWRTIGRPNLMIKVPATEAGVSAVRPLIEEGINVNVTLLFAVARYQEILEAHVSGLENRANRGLPIDQVAGVASFFVSRIDVAVDREIDARIAASDPRSDALRMLKGKVAIANAKTAYRHYLDVAHGGRWRILADKGALPQRLLWASTGTKNPGYPDVLYIDNLIGPDTVNTMPPTTMDAFRDHGTVAPTLNAGIAEARSILAETKLLGVDLDAITAELLRSGVEQFAEAAARSIEAVAGRQRAMQVVASVLDGRTGQ